MAVIPYPHPPPCVCRASTGFCWTITAYTVLSSAGMAQGFAGPARLLPDALLLLQVNAQTLCVWGGAVKPIPYPHPPPCVCRASTGFGWTVTAYTAVLSSAGMAQGFAGPARLIPDALRVATGR